VERNKKYMKMGKKKDEEGNNKIYNKGTKTKEVK
jgi:hypothetical protein